MTTSYRMRCPIGLYILMKMANLQQKKRDSSCNLKLREEELILRMTKEIVIKFIEVGKVTPDSFEEAFDAVHRAVVSAISGDRDNSLDVS